MARRVVAIVAGVVAVITGGIAGGAVAFAVFAVPAQPSAPVAMQDAVAVVERTRSEPQAEASSAATPVEATAPQTTAVDTTAPQATAPQATSHVVVPSTGTAAAAATGCPSGVTGLTPGAPGIVSAGGVAGTTGADMEAFAAAYNATRIANCLAPVPLANFRYDACMELRLFWMAEDPSSDTSSAWGHIGSQRSDGLPSVGCDGNLAGGWNNVGTTFARKWWESTGHRISVYRPDYTGDTSSVCIYFAVTHGGVPDEPVAFARAAARWGDCAGRVPGDDAAWTQMRVASH